jgi:predicted anti-sigma-YlaC factor YlaD
MQSLIEMLVAVEMLLLPAWVGAAFVRPPDALGRRLLRAAVPVAAAAALLVILAAFVSAEEVAGVLRAQAVAGGFLVLLVGLAAALDRVAGPRAAQMLTTLLGWLVLAAVILAGPAVELAGPDGKEPIVRTVVYANPLVVAEHELGLKWLHQRLTYQLTPIGESYAYLFSDLAWWKTLLAHLFVGSGLFVFSLRRAAER